MARADLEEIVAEANRLRAAGDGGAAGDWAALWRATAALVTAPEPAAGAAAAATRRRPGGEPPGSRAACAAGVEAFLGHPSRRLAAYGTLRPGGPNHHIVAGLGSWRAGSVRGALGTWEGYPVLRPGPGHVPVMVLDSPVLGDHLARLDAFEGPAYRRVWVVVDHGPGTGPPDTLQVAQCYVGA